MSKINISFNNKNYSIDEQALSTSTAALKSHLSTVMNGTGATINFGGDVYGVDSTKLTAAKNDFVTYLGTIAGNGHKVIVDGREYSIDSAKVAGAISDIEAVLAGTGEERLEGDGAEYYTLAPTALSFRSTAPLNELQEIQINGVTVDPSNYTLEEGSTIVTFPIDYLKTLNVGNYEVAVASDSKTVKGDFTVKAPELNENGFYYNQPYTAYVAMLGGKKAFFLREDGTLDVIDVASGGIETGTFTCNGKNASMTISIGTLTGTWADDGKSIYCNELQVTAVLGDNSIISDEDYIYIYKEDLGGYEVKAIDKTKAEYGAIKTGINGIDTVQLAEGMFANNENLLIAPNIPDSVTTIGFNAFYSCSSLTGVIIPDSVTRIEWGAFENCENLTSVTIGSGVVSIGSGIFRGCSSLASIEIPDSVTDIGSSAFTNCSSLESIAIPDSVTNINDYTFQYCTLLTSIYIGDAVASIGQWAFSNCSNLTNIIFEGTVEQWNIITKGAGWNTNVPATYVQCSDGQVAL